MRELTGGIYVGEPRLIEETPKGERAVDTMCYETYEVERIVKQAFEMAEGRNKTVTSVDKSNVLDTSRLWEQVTKKTAEQWPDTTLNQILVDTCAMQLVRDPTQLDVMVTGNMLCATLTAVAYM